MPALVLHQIRDEIVKCTAMFIVRKQVGSESFNSYDAVKIELKSFDGYTNINDYSVFISTLYDEFVTSIEREAILSKTSIAKNALMAHLQSEVEILLGNFKATDGKYINNNVKYQDDAGLLDLAPDNAMGEQYLIAEYVIAQYKLILSIKNLVEQQIARDNAIIHNQVEGETSKVRVDLPKLEVTEFNHLFASKDKCLEVMKILVDKNLIDANSHTLDIRRAGAKNHLAFLLYDILNRRRYYVRTPKAEEIVLVVKNTFGAKISLSTVKHAKGNLSDFAYIPALPPTGR